DGELDWESLPLQASALTARTDDTNSLLRKFFMIVSRSCLTDEGRASACARLTCVARFRLPSQCRPSCTDVSALAPPSPCAASLHQALGLVRNSTALTCKAGEIHRCS